MLTCDFRLPPGPRTVEYALLAEELGFRAVWCPEIPAFGHDIWVTIARIAEKTNRIKFGPSVVEDLMKRELTIFECFFVRIVEILTDLDFAPMPLGKSAPEKSA